MTNKLPVVGQRYKHKKLEANGVLGGWYVNQIIPFGIFNFDDGREIEIRGEDLEDFFSAFEELPTSNSQETEEVKVNKKANPVDLKKGEVNEIDKALEELKQAISTSLGKITCVNDVNKLNFKLMDVRIAAQNLINTLEAEKEPFFKIREEGHFEGSPPTKQTDAKIEEFIKDYKRNNRENTSKEKPKIDMKEECVDPVSIWKDVSELPRCLDGAAVFYKRDGQTIDKVCLVGDFIKSFEELKRK